MQTKVQIIIGTSLMAGCGSAISTHFGFTWLQTALLAGFAVGIALLGQAPSLALRARVAQLEAQVAAASNNVAVQGIKN
ncbi:MAG TPA: hypothetical protein VMH83_03455 [Candidatus Acidoferrum sp.]|nr:hypothetical protein [Candidatus Acidoferrum sp.]